MNIHKEISFENDICGHLAANGWLHAPGDAAGHDRMRALFPTDLTAWVQATQPVAWDALAKTHGAAAETVLADRLRKNLDDRGALEVLRTGIEIAGVKTKIAMAQFRPAMSMNPEITRRYDANRLRVVRQVRYSTANENCLDLVLYLNGIPVATAELKTDFTQAIGDAVDQYRFDRHPNPRGGKAETLLGFPGGALVHFAVSNSKVAMTTRLAGPATRFLPFNKGDHGGKGNPLNPHGHRTAYLWEEVWQRDSWLEILGRYLVTKRDTKKQITSVTDLEKRAIFYRRLLPLLAFGREREGVDLSGVQLTHHSLKSQGKRDLTFGIGEAPKLSGMAEVCSGGIHEKEKALLDEIIERVNGLFDGELSDEDQLAYVTGFLRSHMAASDELRVQAANNTSAQFANSPTLRRELMDAAMDSDAAFNAMSRQVLNSETVREELLKILLGPGQLYERLRGEADL